MLIWNLLLESCIKDTLFSHFIDQLMLWLNITCNFNTSCDQKLPVLKKYFNIVQIKMSQHRNQTGTGAYSVPTPGKHSLFITLSFCRFTLCAGLPFTAHFTMSGHPWWGPIINRNSVWAFSSRRELVFTPFITIMNYNCCCDYYPKKRLSKQ